MHLLVALAAVIVVWLLTRHVLGPALRFENSQARRTRRGRGLPVQELARRLGLTVEELRDASPAYRSCDIPKRSTRSGSRPLRIPDAPTKRLQRLILRRLLRRLRVHPAATGFERGCSIVRNATAHSGQCVIIKLDLVDFFNNTTEARIDAYFRRIGWDEDAAALLTRLCTDRGGLPQGAPTSPALANRVNFGLDASISSLVATRRGTYTRYADDITISFPRDFPRKLRGIMSGVGRRVRKRGYRLHPKKRHILRNHQRKLVTGLVVNDGVRLPRRQRRWLRAVKHRVATTGRSTLTDEQLAGWLAFENMVNAPAERDADVAPNGH